MAGYLQALTFRLADAIARLPTVTRERHAAYLRSAQRNDGGFAGREGGSDLYYTSFGLRSLAMLGELDEVCARRAGQFLQGRLTGRESIVDFLSLVYGAALLELVADVDVFADAPGNWREAVAKALGELRRPDGGYAKGPEGRASSTYHTFLVMLCLELIDSPTPDPEAIVGFLKSQRCEGGGFREISVSKRAGTNPTAAAIGALQILEALDSDLRDGCVDFLADMQTDEGGLRANTRIPIADLLSTFTGILSLQDLGAAKEIDMQAARHFAESLEQPDGGFHGAAWDTAHDVEYTFYGLGTLALTTG
jgi:geranylgeranyl transferase type-2 subunit beta